MELYHDADLIAELNNFQILRYEQTYDRAFASMVVKLGNYVIPLINEAFGEHISETAKVVVRNSKHIIRHLDGRLSRRDSDAYLEVTEVPATASEPAVTATDPAARYFHFECETWYEKSVFLRIAEYGSAIAIENAFMDGDEVVFNYPWSSVIFLRSDSTVPEAMKITHRGPNGAEMSYEVPALQIRDYSVEELFEKKLLILLPFYLFRFANEFKEMNRDAEKQGKIKEALREINDRLEAMAHRKEITVYEQLTIQELLQRVSAKLLADYENVKEGVDEIMSGYILRTRADDILDRGIAIGTENGIKIGTESGIIIGTENATRLTNFLWRNGRGEDAIRAETDSAYRSRLLDEFNRGTLSAK